MVPVPGSASTRSPAMAMAGTVVLWAWRAARRALGHGGRRSGAVGLGNGIQLLNQSNFGQAGGRNIHFSFCS
jgi:hypothetical protein